jgi:hypothetical protein
MHGNSEYLLPLRPDITWLFCKAATLLAAAAALGACTANAFGPETVSERHDKIVGGFEATQGGGHLLSR